MHVLLIEDDPRLTRLMKQVLDDEHLTVDVASDGETGLNLALHGLYDVAVIDWMLPGRDGPSICRAIRAARRPLATMLLTARDQVEDRVAGLNSGADDYLVKPFAFEELLARVRALGRRVSPAGSAPDELRWSDIVLDLAAHTARRGERVLDLTVTEWNLLECLLRHPHQTLTREQILDCVWSFDADVLPKMVDIYISYLRRKLSPAGEPDPILTVRGIGYRLRPADV